MIGTGPDAGEAKPVGTSMAPGNGDQFSIIIDWLAHGGKRLWRAAFQDHPDDGRICRIRATALISTFPRRLQSLGYLHHRFGGAAGQEIGQPADQDDGRLVCVDPPKITERLLLGRVFDHLC